MNRGSHPTLPPLSVFLRLFIVAAFATASVEGRAQIEKSSTAPSQPMIDLNHNGMSDIWEWTYDAYGIDPNVDSDGDGYVNWEEAIAGTDPFDSSSYPRIPIVSNSFGGFSVTLPSAAGKVYTLESVTNLGGTNWVIETNAEAPPGPNLTLTVPESANAKFYRVSISDTNSDGTGLMNDWEKYQLGLNPTNALSNGSQDSFGNAMSDYAYATNLLASQNVVTITATDPTATQPDPGQPATGTGQFTVTRGGFPLGSLTVYLALGGPGSGFATPGTDYVNLPGAVILPAGTSSATITL